MKPPELLINIIIYQIVEVIPELRPYVARIIEAEPSILDRSIEEQMRRLLLEPLRQVPWVFCPSGSKIELLARSAPRLCTHGGETHCSSWTGS